MTSSAQLALDGTHPMYETEQGIENRRWQGCARGLTDDKRRWNQWQLVTESPMAAALSSRIGESFCWGGAKRSSKLQRPPRELAGAAQDVAGSAQEPAAQGVAGATREPGAQDRAGAAREQAALGLAGIAAGRCGTGRSSGRNWKLIRPPTIYQALAEEKKKKPTEGGGTGEEQKNRTGWGRRSVRSGRELVGSGAQYYSVPRVPNSTIIYIYI